VHTYNSILFNSGLSIFNKELICKSRGGRFATPATRVAWMSIITRQSIRVGPARAIFSAKTIRRWRWWTRAGTRVCNDSRSRTSGYCDVCHVGLSAVRVEKRSVSESGPFRTHESGWSAREWVWQLKLYHLTPVPVLFSVTGLRSVTDWLTD